MLCDTTRIWNVTESLKLDFSGGLRPSGYMGPEPGFLATRLSAQLHGTASHMHTLQLPFSSHILVGRKEQGSRRRMASLSLFALLLVVGSDAKGGLVIKATRSMRACVPTGSGLRIAQVNFTNEGRISTRLIAVHERNDWVSDMISWNGVWEMNGPSAFLNGLAHMGNKARLPRPGGTFLDIGANVGYYTLMFADRGDHVIAIEPLYRNRAAIQATLCLNQDIRARVRLVAAALGTSTYSSSGMSCVMRPQVQRNSGNGMLECGLNYTCKSLEPPSVDTLNQRTGMSATLAQWRQLPCDEVQLKPLDAVLAKMNPRNIKVVKIDIEGHECLALDGGRTLFTKYRPKLVMAEWKAAHVAACMRKMAVQYGYIAGTAWGADKNVALWDDSPTKRYAKQRFRNTTPI